MAKALKKYKLRSSPDGRAATCDIQWTCPLEDRDAEMISIQTSPCPEAAPLVCRYVEAAPLGSDPHSKFCDLHASYAVNLPDIVGGAGGVGGVVGAIDAPMAIVSKSGGLKEMTIGGNLVWPDGTPITNRMVLPTVKYMWERWRLQGRKSTDISAGMSAFLGRVNSDVWNGKAIGTVLCLPYEVNGNDVAGYDTTVEFEFQSLAWNKVYREETHAWEMLSYPDAYGSPTTNYLYSTAVFADLPV